MLSLLHQFYAMGSDCALHLYGESAKSVELLAAAAEQEIRRIETRYSCYRSDSELARINKVAATGGATGVDAETAGLIAYAKACFAKSDGAFDITSGRLRAVWDFSASGLPDQRSIDAALPFIGLDNLVLADGQLHFRRPGMELDFGDLGMRHGLIDLGGDIRVVGPQPNGLPWRIGIRHPRDADRLAAEIALRSGALATSGDYERFIEDDGRRYCHILDPKTGWPAQGLSSVTVISDRCLVAGSLSTAAMLKGSAGAGWLRRLGVRHLVIDEDGNPCGTEPPLTRFD